MFGLEVQGRELQREGFLFLVYFDFAGHGDVLWQLFAARIDFFIAYQQACEPYL